MNTMKRFLFKINQVNQISKSFTAASLVPGYRSRGPGSILGCYQIFREVVGLERGPLSLVSTTEELLERKCSGSGLENREYGRRDPSRWPRSTLYPQKLSENVLPVQFGTSSLYLTRNKKFQIFMKHKVKGILNWLQLLAFSSVSGPPQ
jgi:hypothetical protein